VARTQIATSAFTGTDGAVPTGFTDLNGVDGQVQISGNKVTVPYTDVSDIVWSGAGSFTNDQYAKMVITGLANPGSLNKLGVTARSSTDGHGARDMYRCYVYEDNTTTIVLEKSVNDVVTSLGTATPAFANGNTVEIECTGTSISGLVNGVVVIGPVTDAALSTGKPGVTGEMGFSTNILGDDWEAGNLGASGNPNLFVGKLGHPFAGKLA
jgi:hypothetical protein